MSNPGKCLCGSVTWEVNAEPAQAYNCHCKMCRKAHGAAFATYWFFDEGQFQWTGSKDTIVNYQSSHLLTRSFCGTCGSVVPHQSEQSGKFVAPAGCHDTGRPSDCNIFVAHSAPWYDIGENLPTHDDYPPDSGYESLGASPDSSAEEGKVRGSCLCGGIEFHVTEPFKVAHNCHCTRCRQGRAAAHASNAFTSMQGVSFLKGEELINLYKVPEAKHFTQAFCKKCGAKMPRIDEHRKIAVTPMGSLDDDPGIKPVDHIYVASMARWHEITGELPQFDEAPPD